MHLGEVVVVQLTAGLRLARYVETRVNRVRVAIGRNCEARLPDARVVRETGLSASSFETVEDLTRRVESIAAELDVEEVWDLVCEDGQALTLEDIAELYWGAGPSEVQTVGLLLLLSRDDLRFTKDGFHYVPVDRDTVEQTVGRRQRRVQRAADAEALAQWLREGDLPEELTEHQSGLLADIRRYVLHGDDYFRAAAAKRIVEEAGVRGRDLQRGAFELLVSAGVLDADQNLDLEREGIPTEFSAAARITACEVDSEDTLNDQSRLDLTRLAAFTIDDADTRDRDDALSIQRLDDETYRVGIHVTDVGALIPPGSTLNVEAESRMSSVYLPEGTIDMLPPKLSADRASLVPGQRRAALSVLADFGAEEEMNRAIVTHLEQTHNLAEHAGAASLAAALKIKHRLCDKKVVLVMSGGNLSIDHLKIALAGSPGS